MLRICTRQLFGQQNSHFAFAGYDQKGFCGADVCGGRKNVLSEIMVQKWLVLCSMLWSIPAFACKCNHQDIESSFKSADFVFVANIYSTVNEFPGLQQNNPILLSRAKIVKSYKSPSEFSFYQTKEVTLLSSSLDTCDYPFVAHGKYLFSDSSIQTANLCIQTIACQQKYSQNFRRRS